MPANLTPDYERAEAKYRSAADDDERLLALREMYTVLPKLKGTEKLQAELKQRMSHLRLAISRAPRKTADVFHVPKSGAGQVVLFGAPNTGKSSIVLALTGAHVKVADYPFSTAVPVPGMAHYEDVQIGLVDTPPVSAGHMPAGLLGTLRSCDIIAIVVDASADPLDDAQIALDLLQSNGLSLRTAAIQEIDPSDVADHCALLIANKMDLASADTLETLHDLYAPKLEVIGVSATAGTNLNLFIERAWQLLSSIRVYTKQPGEAAASTKPHTLPIGSTVEDLAREIHRELPAKMKFARVWGKKHMSGMQVHRSEELHDKDVVEIHE